MRNYERIYCRNLEKDKKAKNYRLPTKRKLKFQKIPKILKDPNRTIPIKLYEKRFAICLWGFEKWGQYVFDTPTFSDANFGGETK